MAGIALRMCGPARVGSTEVAFSTYVLCEVEVADQAGGLGGDDESVDHPGEVRFTVLAPSVDRPVSNRERLVVLAWTHRAHLPAH